MEEANKEIDLIELYQKILVFISKNFLTFIIFIIIGLLSGTAFYYKNKSVIKTHYLIETSDVSKQFIYSLIEKISFDLASKNYESLKSNFSLGEDLFSDIKDVKIDTADNILSLSIVSFSKENLQPFRKGLIYFLNNQELLLKEKEEIRKETTDLLHEIEKEIGSINEFQKQFLSEDKESNVTINQLNGLHSEKIRLFKMKQECEKKLKEKDLVNVINKDNNIVKSDYNLLKILAISIFSSILFSFFYFFIRFSIALKNRA